VTGWATADRIPFAVLRSLPLAAGGIYRALLRARLYNWRHAAP
jgi:hypothetical protein